MTRSPRARLGAGFPSEAPPAFRTSWPDWGYWFSGSHAETVPTSTIGRNVEEELTRPLGLCRWHWKIPPLRVVLDLAVG